MTDTANHPGEGLQDFLDDRLDDARRTEISAHLQGCPRCRAELEALRWVRDVALKQLPGEEVPPALAGRVAAALDEADHAPPATSPLLGQGRRRWAAAASLVAAVLVLLLLWPSRVDLAEAVASDFTEYSRGDLPLDLRSLDREAVESLFVAGGIEFPTRVFDLGMMGYQLVGGRVHRLDHRSSALFAYRGPENRDLVCQMYQGRIADLPPPHEMREHDGISFQVYRAGELTLVFWQEGSVVCVLASDVEPEAVIQLAYAKAVKV